MTDKPHSLTLDLETRSYADLKKVGAWSYSEHETTLPICACWGIDDLPIQEWTPDTICDGPKGMPYDLYHALAAGVPIEAHNVSFELSFWLNVMVKRFGWITPGEEQWRDTAAVARYYALPAALDRLARVLGFEGKDPEGSRLITKYSKLHLKTAKTVIPPEDLRKFIDYCRKDVMIEQSISDYLGDLPEREMENFHFDRRMNLKGIFLDAEGIAAASAVVDQRSEELTAKFRELTGLNPGQNEKLMAWFDDHGVTLENLQADVLEELMENGDLPKGIARDAIQIKLQVSKASTKKLDAMARATGADGRARWQTIYHGAVTGRNTGTGLQPLNLRHSIETEKCKALDGSAATFPTPEDVVRDIMHEDAEWLDCVYGDAMETVAQASRHWIKAAPGNTLIAGDFVSIEAVLLACTSGEAWKIEAFRNRVDLYCLMAEKIYGLPAGTVSKKTHPTERQDGKRGELAFGYQGALGAWLKFDPYPIHSDERIIEICKLWRREHPAIVSFWRGLEAAAIEAVEHPGRVTGHRMTGFEIVDEWLTMVGPSGKRIWYRDPQLRAGMPPWHKPAEPFKTVQRQGEEPRQEPNPCHTGECDCQPIPKLTYMAQKNGQWRRVSTYGGKLTENWCQFTSRELLMPAARRAEKYGYPVILTVYDEIVTEVPKGFGSAKELEEIMIEDLPEWAATWPINAEAWIGDRYKK